MEVDRDRHTVERVDDDTQPVDGRNLLFGERFSDALPRFIEEVCGRYIADVLGQFQRRTLRVGEVPGLTPSGEDRKAVGALAELDRVGAVDTEAERAAIDLGGADLYQHYQPGVQPRVDGGFVRDVVKLQQRGVISG
jgi:hypothetical protein